MTINGQDNITIPDPILLLVFVFSNETSLTIFQIFFKKLIWSNTHTFKNYHVNHLHTVIFSVAEKVYKYLSEQFALGF